MRNFNRFFTVDNAGERKERSRGYRLRLGRPRVSEPPSSLLSGSVTLAGSRPGISGGNEKQKQPRVMQRGHGIAHLEKLRLQELRRSESVSNGESQTLDFGFRPLTTPSSPRSLSYSASLSQEDPSGKAYSAPVLGKNPAHPSFPPSLPPSASISELTSDSVFPIHHRSSSKGLFATDEERTSSFGSFDTSSSYKRQQKTSSASLFEPYKTNLNNAPRRSASLDLELSTSLKGGHRARQKSTRNAEGLIINNFLNESALTTSDSAHKPSLSSRFPSNPCDHLMETDTRHGNAGQEARTVEKFDRKSVPSFNPFMRTSALEFSAGSQSLAADAVHPKREGRSYSSLPSITELPTHFSLSGPPLVLQDKSKATAPPSNPSLRGIPSDNTSSKGEITLDKPMGSPEPKSSSLNNPSPCPTTMVDNFDTAKPRDTSSETSQAKSFTPSNEHAVDSPNTMPVERVNGLKRKLDVDLSWNSSLVTETGKAAENEEWKRKFSINLNATEKGKLSDSWTREKDPFALSDSSLSLPSCEVNTIRRKTLQFFEEPIFNTVHQVIQEQDKTFSSQVKALYQLIQVQKSIASEAKAHPMPSDLSQKINGSMEKNGASAVINAPKSKENQQAPEKLTLNSPPVCKFVWRA